QGAARGEASHEVRLAPDSLLAHLSGAERLAVNSMHHQAVARTGAGAVPVAWSDDGIIEGFELAANPRVLAVQWHPEELVSSSEAARALFGWVVGDDERA